MSYTCVHTYSVGYKIPVVENLGVTMDLYDTIDLSENDLMKLDNFPLLKNLQTLLLSNNRISLVSPSLSSSVPKLQTIMFTNNKLKAFRDIDSLAQFKGLHTLSLTGNPVCKTAHYREYVIFRLPHLKLLDFNKIKPRVR